MTKRSIKIASIILPLGSKRRIVAKRLLKISSKPVTNKNLTYPGWIQKAECNSFRETPAALDSVRKRPLISIVVPCFNTPDKYFLPLIKSVKNQLYDNWELCLVNASNDESIRKKIGEMSNSDKRINHILIEENLGIVGNTNIGIVKAKGEFIAFLDHDDTLSPFALAEVVIAYNEAPKTDLFYSDEDKLTDNGKTRLLPFFKPDWSPQLLWGVNYITHFVVAKKKLVDTIGGLRPGFDGAQDYDFLLRLTELTNNIIHIPKILYHWRLADGSTSKNVGEKNYADTAGRRALTDAMKRRGLKAEVVEILDRPTNYRPKFELPPSQALVSIIIPFKDKVELLRQCVPSIFNKTTYQNYELILVSNNSTEASTYEYLNELKVDHRCRIYEWNEPFNYSAVNNFGRTKAKGEFLVFLNNDTEVITPEWLDELIGVASLKETGVVGPLLYYPDKTIQHAGVVLGMGGMAGHVFRRRKPEEWTDFGLPCWPRNYLAVTGACLVIKSIKFDEVHGFDELLRVGGNDVALCLSLHERGYSNIFWPFAELIHYENVSVGLYTQNVPQTDYDRSLVYYKKYIEKGDAYFNPNLNIMNEQVGL